MKRKTATFSICIFIIYILTVLLLGTSLIMEYTRGQTLCEDRFNTLTRDTASAAALAEPGTPLFAEGFKSAIGTVDDIAVVQLSADGTLIFSYPADVSRVPAGSSFFVRSFSTELNTKNSTLRLSAVIYKISPKTIFTRCAIAFIIILIATFAVVLYMIATSGEKETDAATFVDQNKAKTESDRDSTEDLNAGEKTKKHSEKEEPFAEEKLDVKEEPEQEEIQEEDEPEENGDDQSPVDDQSPADDQSPDFEPEAVSAEPEKPQTAVETGLFSPTTGFGWQSYMKPRLESELERAAASDMDLSLISIRIPGLPANTDCSREIEKAILSTAGFKDLVFENGPDGYSVIMQELDIDAALRRSEELYDKIERELAYENLSIKHAIGVSSRSLRLISADRLTNESEQALAHALKEEGKRIIAFRVNPDKYRNFLLSGNTN